MANAPLASFIPATSATFVGQTEHSLTFRLVEEFFRVDVLGANLVRFKMTSGGRFDEKPTYSVIGADQYPGADFSLKVDSAKVTVTTSQLTITVRLSPFEFTVVRRDGSLVMHNTSFISLNDEFILKRSIGSRDQIYGLGEKTGKFNRRGRTFTMWNIDLIDPNASGPFGEKYPKSDPRSNPLSTSFDPYYMSIPFFYQRDYASGRIAGFFIDNAYKSNFDFTKKLETTIHFEGGQYTEYVFGGPDLPEILETYTSLTGRTSVPPIWALGYHQCRYHLYTQQQVLDIVAKHKELDIPLDSMWLDIHYMDGYRVFTWDTKLFPNYKKMLEEIRADGVRAITIIDPGVKHDPGYWVYDSGKEEDIFCRTDAGGTYIGQVWPGNTAFPDFASEDGRRWWGRLTAQHVQSGLAGIWNDMNEPATGVVDSHRMLFNKGTETHERRHNEYGLLMVMGTVDGLREAMPNLRTFVLSRAGSPGIQRYAANWLGDNCSRWDHLWMSMPMGMGLSLSGQPFVGSDIGGFLENTNAELFMRWMQMATFMPFARNHNNIDNRDQYVWSFSKQVLDASREALKLRYRLMPYLYSSFVDAASDGSPIQRPLIFDYQWDAKVTDLDDQYLYGPNLLVAPVYEKGMKERTVYLPEGEWFDFFSNEAIRGGKKLTVPVTKKNIPVYAKAGAVIPMWQEAPLSTDGYAPDCIDLHVYVPEANGRYESDLREDDGLTFDAENGDFVHTHLILTKSAKRLTLKGEVSGNGYASFNRSMFRVVLHGGPTSGETITIDNTGEDFELNLNRF